MLKALGALIRGLIQHVAERLKRRMKKVDIPRHCVICGASPNYMLRTVNTSKDHAHIRGSDHCFYVCGEHHPNPRVGRKSDELHHFLKKIDPELTYNVIFPHNPYS